MSKLHPPTPPGARIESGRRSFPPSAWWRWTCETCGQSETALDRETQAVARFKAHVCGRQSLPADVHAEALASLPAHVQKALR